MKFAVRHIPLLYLFILFAGMTFFIPDIFVSRFATAPALWMQGIIGIGIAGYVLLRKKPIPLPPKRYLSLIIIWAIYHIWQSRENIENSITIVTLAATFFLLHAIRPLLKDKKTPYALFALLATMLSLWGSGQYARLLPSYNGSFAITGPFDNPAGISASLAVLLPFQLYCCRHLSGIYRLPAIVAACLSVTVIALSQARAAILATVIISIFFSIHLLKERNFKLLPAHRVAISLSCLLLFAGLFFMKKDSASGRLLIWQCSAQLVSGKPVFGYGANGFTANYMNEQASFFTQHPDSKYVMLADNIRHPFNEFLKWTVNYGMTGLCLTLLLVTLPLWLSRKKDSPELFFIRLSLLSTALCALFSYPLNYPFIRLMTAALPAFALAASPQKNITISAGYLSKGIALLLSSGLLCATAYQACCESEWCRIARRSLRGETHQMLPRYSSLYRHLRFKDLFLYNYAAELNVAGKYEESQLTARECDRLWADYDLQMLMADNCLQLQQYSETESYLKKAAAMCPVKFMPLYLLAELYMETGRKEEAQALAQTLVDKTVKVPSPIVNSIKRKMRSLLKEPDSVLNDSLQLIHRDMKPPNITSRQDCPRDQRTPRALLPP